MSTADVFWTIHDESRQREYHAQVVYVVDGLDPGDWTTPPCGGEVELIDVLVVQAKIYDSAGEVCGVELLDAAAKYSERAWQLITADAKMTDRIAKECESVYALA